MFPNTEGFIYVIGREDDIGPIKIGFSGEPKFRLKSFQVGSPHKLKIIGTMPAKFRVEAVMHTRLEAHRLHGEWFDRVPEVMETVEAIRRYVSHEEAIQGLIRNGILPKDYQPGQPIAAR